MNTPNATDKAQGATPAPANPDSHMAVAILRRFRAQQRDMIASFEEMLTATRPDYRGVIADLIHHRKQILSELDAIIAAAVS